MKELMTIKGKNKTIVISKEKNEAMKAWWNQYVIDNRNKNLIKVGNHYISHEKNEAMKAWFKQKKIEQGWEWENARIKKERLEKEKRLEEEVEEKSMGLTLEQKERERINQERIRLQQEKENNLLKEKNEQMQVWNIETLEKSKEENKVKIGNMKILEDKEINLIGLKNIDASIKDNLFLFKNYFNRLNNNSKINIYDISEIEKINYNINTIFCIQPLEITNLVPFLSNFTNKPEVLWVWEFKSLPQIFKDYESLCSITILL